MISSRRVIFGIIIFAACQFGVWTVGFHVRGDEILYAGGALHVAAFETLAWALVGALAAACGWLLPIGRRPSFGRVCLLFLGAFAITVGRLTVNHLAAPALGWDVPPFGLHLLYHFPTHLLIVTSYVGLGCGLRSVRYYYEDQRELVELASDLEATRLNALRNALRPHLLLRALDSSASLIEEDPKSADSLLVQLSGFLRNQLRRPRSNQIPLSREVEFVEQYIALERACFRRNIGLEIRTSADLRSMLVPTGCVSMVLDTVLESVGNDVPEPEIKLILCTTEETPASLTIQASVSNQTGYVDVFGIRAPETVPARATQPFMEIRPLPSGGVEFRYPMTHPPALQPEPTGTLDNASTQTKAPEPSLNDEPYSPAGSGRGNVYQWFLWYWSFVSALFFLQAFLVHSITSIQELVSRSLPIICYIALWMGVSLALFQLSRGRAAFQVRRMVIAAGCACAIGILHHVVQTIAGCALAGGTNAEALRVCFRKTLFLLPNLVAVSVNFFAVGLMIHYTGFQSRKAQKAATIRAETTRAQTVALEKQLRPHFLFNALQSIATLVHREPTGAHIMLKDLRALLSHSMTLPDQEEVGLAEELESVRLYLEVERRRFRDRLSVSYSLEPEALEARVPPFLLQPLVENAVHHAIAIRGEGQIHIIAGVNRGTHSLEVEIVDTGAGSSEVRRESHGIGLQLARSRLTNMYGPDAVLELASVPRGGTRVSIRLPAPPSHPTA